ncbi:MAG TPA: DUF6046 domain-containing protein [Hanamia sp.]
MANERNFILKSFGLEYLKAAVYPAGKQLQPGNTDMSSAAKKDIADLDYNMSTLQNGKAPVSMLGTPVFADLILQSDKKGSIQLQLLWALLEVNMQKNIVKTAVQGRDGTVKEYISDGDYQVTIRGGLFSPFSNAYPKEDMQTIMQLMKLNTPLTVISEYLLHFNVYELVVEDYSFSQKEGVQNVQLFEIKTVSDFPIELKKK